MEHKKTLYPDPLSILQGVRVFLMETLYITLNVRFIQFRIALLKKLLYNY